MSESGTPPTTPLVENEAKFEPVPRWRLGLVDPNPGGRAWIRQRRDDPLGYGIHLLLGVLGLIALTLPTSIMEFAMAPALVATIVRTPRLWRTWGALALQPHMLALIAWVAVQGLSSIWTADRAQWLDEFGVVRFAIIPLVLWPLLAHREALALALGVGLLAGVGVQVLHLAGVVLDVAWLDWDRKPGRVSGWWDPVVGGSLLVAGLGLFLAPMPRSLGSKRWRGLPIAVFMLAGVALTGTRGAWLASAALLVVGLALLLLRAPKTSWRRASKPMLAAIGASVFIVAATAFLAGPRLADRARDGYQEITQAIEQKQFDTDTGTRLLLNWWAIEAFTQRPLTGVGVGGYRAWTEQHLTSQDIPLDRYILHGHAHNATLHTLATTGLLGAIPAAICVGFVLVAGYRAPAGGSRGPALALTGLLLVSVFDTVHVNQQTAAVLFALIALCPTWIPREADAPT